ncbi:hypothetical protein K474DRAFT_1409225 [Panus rudis PR-1116 ss-1]|nr:hypothetical protein K474DRAFT_1409225 [Panus rudis PR-1116 ss-1]
MYSTPRGFWPYPQVALTPSLSHSAGRYSLRSHPERLRAAAYVLAQVDIAPPFSLLLRPACLAIRPHQLLIALYTDYTLLCYTKTALMNVNFTHGVIIDRGIWGRGGPDFVLATL